MSCFKKEQKSPKYYPQCQVKGVDADARSVVVQQSVFLGEGVGQATKLYGGFKPE